MNAKYAPVIVAGLLGLALSVNRHIVAITIDNSGVPDAEQIQFLTHASNVAGFVLPYVVLLGLAYWAGGRLQLRRQYGWLAGVTFLATAVGYLLGALLFVYPILSSTGESVLSIAVIFLGGAIALGVKLSVVSLAGASLAHFR